MVPNTDNLQLLVRQDWIPKTCRKTLNLKYYRVRLNTIAAVTFVIPYLTIRLNSSTLFQLFINISSILKWQTKRVFYISFSFILYYRLWREEFLCTIKVIFTRRTGFLSPSLVHQLIRN
jgi:hypothetical protein